MTYRAQLTCTLKIFGGEGGGQEPSFVVLLSNSTMINNTESTMATTDLQKSTKSIII